MITKPREEITETYVVEMSKISQGWEPSGFTATDEKALRTLVATLRSAGMRDGRQYRGVILRQTKEVLEDAAPTSRGSSDDKLG